MGPCQSSIWKATGKGGGGFLGARLMWCQTWLRGALITALSVTEVAVGIDMVTVGWLTMVSSGIGDLFYSREKRSKEISRLLNKL